METWFEVSGDRIKEVSVAKVNPATVVLRRKEFRITWGADLEGELADNTERFIDKTVRKNGAYEDYFPTWEQAHACVLERAESNLIAARRQLSVAQGRLGNVKGMKKPEAA